MTMEKIAMYFGYLVGSLLILGGMFVLAESFVRNCMERELSRLERIIIKLEDRFSDYTRKEADNATKNKRRN